MSVTTTRETGLLQAPRSFATIPGTAGPDTLNGGAAADSISGAGGADQLFGKGGNDSLYGGGGNDTLYGGNGADLLDGGKGNDLFVGGGGADDFILRKSQGNDSIQGFQDGIDEIRYLANGGDTVKFMIHYNGSAHEATVSIKVNGVITNTILVDNVDNGDLTQSQQGNTLILG